MHNTVPQNSPLKLGNFKLADVIHFLFQNVKEFQSWTNITFKILIPIEH